VLNTILEFKSMGKSKERIPASAGDAGRRPNER
jgi:hypothetical protein